jgi:hypothetical protein
MSGAWVLWWLALLVPRELAPLSMSKAPRPREFGQDSSLWTLEMAAQVAFEEGLTERRVSGETVRATLSRLLAVRWQRAKRWITSPDSLYERKKEGAID